MGIVGASTEELESVASEYGIAQTYTDYHEALAQSGAEAVILATPTPLHTQQSLDALKAGLHVLVEIPMAESAADTDRLVQAAQESDRVAMVAHTRRFNPPHQWIRGEIAAGRLHLHHLVVETFFHRRENKNALGQRRDWADSLLWHHAAHSVDLFLYQTGEEVAHAHALQGPESAEIQGPLDISLSLKSSGGALASVALSFNNAGPFGSWFRYICQEGTYIVRYDDITDGEGNEVDYHWQGPTNGIELQDREFIAAITEGREPRSSVAQGAGAMQVLQRLQDQLDS